METDADLTIGRLEELLRGLTEGMPVKQAIIAVESADRSLSKR